MSSCLLYLCTPFKKYQWLALTAKTRLALKRFQVLAYGLGGQLRSVRNRALNARRLHLAPQSDRSLGSDAVFLGKIDRRFSMRFLIDAAEPRPAHGVSESIHRRIEQRPSARRNDQVQSKAN